MYNINSIIIIKYTEIILINNLNKFHLFPFISSILFLIELITPNEGLSNLTKYDSKQLKPKVNGIITTEQFKDLITDYNKNEDKYNDQIKENNEHSCRNGNGSWIDSKPSNCKCIFNAIIKCIG